MSALARPSLIGRENESRIIDDLLASARVGVSGTAVFVGDPGIGKTALLRYAAASALDMRCLELVGVDAEAAFGYAALHRLLLPVLDGAASVGSLKLRPGAVVSTHAATDGGLRRLALVDQLHANERDRRRRCSQSL